MIARKTHHEFTPGLVNNTDMKSIREEGLEGVLSPPPPPTKSHILQIIYMYIQTEIKTNNLLFLHERTVIFSI